MNAEALCRSCGFCCDGSLFTHVTVADPHERQTLRTLGLPIDESPPPRLPQPCAGYRDGCCQVYEVRPTECRHFRCQVLIACESGTRAWEDAAALVTRARRLRQDALDGWALVEPDTHGQTLAALQARLRAAGDMPPAMAARWAAVLLPLARFQTLLRDHFHRPA